MFGCLRRLGCLVILLVIGAGAWLTRDDWLPHVVGSPAAEEPVGPAWESVTVQSAARGRAAVAQLGTARGPASVALRPSEVAGYVLEELLRTLPASAEAPQASVIGDRIYVRVVLPLRDLGGDVLGPLAGMVGDDEPLLLGGTLEVVRPGLGQYRIADVKVRDLSLPPAVVPRLLRELRRGGPPPEGIAANGLPLALPDGVGDVRIGGGRVTVYEGAAP